MLVKNRALHFVLKIGLLKQNIEFFRDLLGMKVLRHEVFEEGCQAACNGPYDGKWSKTMIGYGPEDGHFVLELTYNYSIGAYKRGNDLQYIKIALDDEQFEKVRKAKEKGDARNNDVKKLSILSPDGYKFILFRRDKSVASKQDVTEVCLACKNLQESASYWVDLLKMSKQADDKDSPNEVSLKYASDQAALRLKQIDQEVDHGTAYGRIAFSCPSDQLKSIEELVKDAGKYKILTPFVSLDTPGKATVQVVILADGDGHEICFVGDEGFRELSQVDTKANELLDKCIAEDKSDEWYNGKKRQKISA